MSHKKVISFTCKKEKTLNFHKGLFSKIYRLKQSNCFKSVFSDFCQTFDNLFLILRFKVLFSECLSIANVKYLKIKKETKTASDFSNKCLFLTDSYDNNVSNSSTDKPVTSDTTSNDRPFDSILRISSSCPS